MHPTPPRLANGLLQLFLGAEDFEIVAGDLEEQFHTDLVPSTGVRAARAWYWRQVVSVIGGRLVNLRQPRMETPRPKGSVMAATRQDLSYALRSLRKQPGFTAVAVLTLALGIGANVAIFSLVHAVLFKTLPYRDPGRLMLVHLLVPERDAPGVFRNVVWSYPKYQSFREQQRSFESTALFVGREWNLTGSDAPERLPGEFVDASYFDVLGVAPHVGRTFSAEETRAPGSPPTAILGYGLWTRRFGADPGVLGKTIGLNAVSHTIVGVLPPSFRGLSGQAEVWIPLMTLPASDINEAWSHSYRLVARRKADVPVAQAQAEATVLGARLDEQFQDTLVGTHWGAAAMPLDDERVDPLIRRSVLLMLAAVASVLLIVCVNLANLTLVRGLARQREVAIRLALGASRVRIVRQLMTESLLIASAGALAGLLVAFGAVSAAASVMPDLRTVLPMQTAGLTRVGLSMLGLDATTLLFTALVAVATAMLFGMGPAWRASRRDLTATMKSGASGAVSQGTRGFAIRNVLIVGEMALALMLVVAAGLMLKSVARLQATELGFRPASLLTFRLALPGAQYDPPRATAFFDQLLGRLGSRAGVESVGYGNCAPLSGGCNLTFANFPGRPPAPKGSGPLVGVYWASPHYFDALGIRLVRGRVFTDRDRAGQPKVAVINETAARQFWGNDDPIGKHIGVGQGGFSDGAEVVGIVGDVRYNSVETAVIPDVYVPLLQSPRSAGLVFVRSESSPRMLIPEIRQELQALDRDLPLIDVKTMEGRFGDATWRTRMSAWLLGVFGALAVVLAAVGIYGVMAQGVEQRRREIGVRMALGAAPSDIVRLIMSRAFVIGVAGVALGVGLAIPTMRLLVALLYQVQPGDPVVLAVLASVVLLVALVASYVPARRATRVDPLTTLRTE